MDLHRPCERRALHRFARKIEVWPQVLNVLTLTLRCWEFVAEEGNRIPSASMAVAPVLQSRVQLAQVQAADPCQTATDCSWLWWSMQSRLDVHKHRDLEFAVSESSSRISFAVATCRL